MRVKVGNHWYDSKDEPICIQVSETEQRHIADMDRSVATEGKYAVFPDNWRGGDEQEMRDFLKEDR